MAIAPSLLWLFVGRLFSGALGATYPVAAASVADVTEPEERVKQFGVLHAMIGLGLILGPLLGGLAAGHGVRAPFWVAACIATATLIAGYFLFPERSEEHTSELQSLMSKSYAVFCLKKIKIITYNNYIIL